MDYILAIYLCGCFLVLYILLDMYTKYHNDMKQIPLYIKVFVSICLILCSWLALFLVIDKKGDN